MIGLCFSRRFVRILVLGLALAWSSPGMAGHSAEALFLSNGVLDVTVSPSGSWAIAHAVIGETHGLLAQKLGSKQVTPVLATAEPIRSVRWIGNDTFLVFFSGHGPRTVLAARIHDGVGKPELDRAMIRAPGHFVDGLPLVDDTLIWEFFHNDRNSVHRISLDDLIEFHEEKRERWGSMRLGEKLASIDGSARRWIVDRNGNPRAALQKEEGVYTILARKGDSGRFREIYSFEESDEPQAVYPMSLTEDGTRLVVLAYGENDTMGIHEFEIESKSLGARIYGREDVDVTSAVFDPIHGDLIAAVYEDGGERRFHYIDSLSSQHLQSMRSQFPSESLAIVSRSADRGIYILYVSSPTNPGTYYLRDESTSATNRVAQVAEGLDASRLADVTSVEVTSGDGTQLESFLTLPESRDGSAVPLVVFPHGGPIGVRDRAEYNPLVQYLASWGFAVLQVNYRGSSGYGRRFEEAGKKEWARAIEDDIDAAVETVIVDPRIDASRTCILGGSYGGFSALASILRRPERYRCAVTINGVTDIPHSFETSDFADDERVLERFAEVVGDVETNRDHLVAISPAYHVREIETPVYVVYGTDDRRVDPDHSHRLLLMLETLGKEHQSLEVQGGRHGFTTREWIIVAPALRRFLTRHLFPSHRFEPDPEARMDSKFLRLPGVER